MLEPVEQIDSHVLCFFFWLKILLCVANWYFALNREPAGRQKESRLFPGSLSRSYSWASKATSVDKARGTIEISKLLALGYHEMDADSIAIFADADRRNNEAYSAGIAEKKDQIILCHGTAKLLQQYNNYSRWSQSKIFLVILVGCVACS